MIIRSQNIAPCKEIHQTLGFWIPDSNRCGILDYLRCIPDCRYWIQVDSLSVKLSFWILIVSGILDFLSCIPESKAQESGILKQKFPRFPYMYPGYQRFFLECDGELRFVGRRPTRVRLKAEHSLWHPGYLTRGEKYVNSHKVMAPRHSPQSPLFFLSLTPF